MLDEIYRELLLPEKVIRYIQKKKTNRKTNTFSSFQLEFKTNYCKTITFLISLRT